MSIYRVEKDGDNPYVMVNKQILNNELVSWKAKGLLCYMLSMPDDWKFYEVELIKHASDGRASFRTAVKELMNNGYIDRKLLRDKGRFQGYEYTIHEVSDHRRLSDNGISDNGKATTTNNNYTNNDLNNNNILHQTKFDVCLNTYSLKRFNRPLRKSNKVVDIEDLEDYEEEEFIEFLDDNITCYDQCNYDYIETIQARAR